MPGVLTSSFSSVSARRANQGCELPNPFTEGARILRAREIGVKRLEGYYDLRGFCYTPILGACVGARTLGRGARVRGAGV
jgi:hypothetical protein